LVTGPFSTSTADDALDFPGVGNTFFGRTDTRSDTQYAGFGEATWKITDAWTAVAGLRYFTETLNGVQTQTHPFGGFPGAPNLVPIVDPEQKFNKVTWKINSSYKFNDELLAYGTVSTGFRSGGLNAVSEPFEPIPSAYSPDTLTNYEPGAGDHGRRRLRLPGQCRHRPRQGRGIRVHRPSVPVFQRQLRRLVSGCVSHGRRQRRAICAEPNAG